MKKYQLFLISCISGILLSAGWPDKGIAPLLFIAFVPLLWVEDIISKDQTKRFGRFAGFFYSYIPFLIWNILTTYWVWYSTPVAILAFTLNALFMSFAFQLFHFLKKSLYKGNRGYFLLPVFWIAFEFVHCNWDGSWPWLTLGNGFAIMPSYVQWYQFTGVFGGTLWILMSNILTVKLILSFYEKMAKKEIQRRSTCLGTIIIVPIVLSLFMYYNYTEPKSAKKVEVVVLQPNLDPYNEQFELSSREVTQRMLKQAAEKTTDSTQFIIAPESSIQENINEDDLQYSNSIHKIKEFIEQYKQVEFIAGVSTYKIMQAGVKTPAMREIKAYPGRFYEPYNTAMIINRSNKIDLLHKSKLTPGVECMPLQKQLPFIGKLALDLGGTVGSLGIDKERKVFRSAETGIKVGTVICYESIYGEYVGEYVKNGAELLFIITNDGWWKNTPGHRQHFEYARLRAIETRKWIARSANTGISGYISPRGDVFDKTHYWEPAVLKRSLLANNKVTFYARYGDYLGRLASISALFLFLLTIVKNRMKKK